MPVVNNGCSVPLLGRDNAANSRGWKRKNFRIGNAGPMLRPYGNKITEVMADINMIKEHFGLSQSDAMRLALHVVANAIRAGRFNVGPEA